MVRLSVLILYFNSGFGRLWASLAGLSANHLKGWLCRQGCVWLLGYFFPLFFVCLCVAMTCIWPYAWFCVWYWPKQMEGEVWIASAIACQHFSLSHSLSVSPVDETCSEHVQPFQPQQLWVNEPKHLKQVCVSMFFGRGGCCIERRVCVDVTENERKKLHLCVCVSLRGHFSHSTGTTDGDLHQLSNRSIA